MLPVGSSCSPRNIGISKVDLATDKGLFRAAVPSGGLCFATTRLGMWRKCSCWLVRVKKLVTIYKYLNFTVFIPIFTLFEMTCISSHWGPPKDKNSQLLQALPRVSTKHWSYGTRTPQGWDAMGRSTNIKNHHQTREIREGIFHGCHIKLNIVYPVPALIERLQQSERRRFPRYLGKGVGT